MSRPGAGVSRLPLNITAFDAPGFGEVADAINLASGNVYIAMDGLGRNTLLTQGDEGTNTIGEGSWNLIARLRLQGFSASLSAAPSSFWLASGDGSGQTFSKVTPDFSATTLPSWVRRYQPKTTVSYYRNQPVAGTQYNEEWLVLDLSSSGNRAYYFSHDGTRSEFKNNGEYPDSVQTLHQQYLGAKQSNSSADSSTQKTTLTYTSPGSGLVAKVKDAYGRVTTYEWNETNLTLTAINYLLRSETNNATYTRRVEFSYVVPSGTGQRVVSRVTFRAGDGLGGWVSRWVDFSYLTQASGAVLVSEVKRQVVGSASAVKATYTYDASARVERVQETGLPDTTYLYGSSATYGGLSVTVNQSDKSTIYEHDTLGRLRLKNVKDTNPDTGVTRWLPWTYTYTDAPLVTTRLNANGAALTTNGVTWSADAYYVGGKTSSNASIADIQGTTDDSLYKTGRSSYDRTLAYEIPVAASGTYQVRLHFAETYFGATGGVAGGAGKRVFSVNLEGGPVELPNYDIYAAVGPMTAVVKSYDVPVSDGTLNIAFNATVDQPSVSAIEVVPLTEGYAVTDKITAPSGQSDEYAYDARGNPVSHTLFAGTTVVRSDEYAYDADNQLTSETLYGSETVQKAHAVPIYHSFTTPDGLTFKAPKQLRHATNIGTGPTAQEKFYVLEDYDEQGRLTQSQRVGAGQTQTTTFTYQTGSLWQPYLPDLFGSPFRDSVKGPAIKQYGDLVATRTTTGLGSRNYQYDALGNVVWEEHPSAFVSNVAVSGTTFTQTFAERTTLHAYNGFGQHVWERLENEVYDSITKSMWYYHPTGELKYSWNADVGNVNVYTYNTVATSPDLGRLAMVVGGEDSDGNGTVDIQLERTDYAYDTFGRVGTQTKDGFATTYSYDTLDRVAKELRPDGGSTSTVYHLSGEVEKSSVRETKPSVQVFVTTMTLDALGRATGTTYPDGSTVTTTYDAFDRPTKVLDNRLTMNAAGDDRASFYFYDGLGNLTKELRPALRTLAATGVYTDSRRPYVEYSYDDLGRRTQERRLLNGTVSPANPALPSGAAVALTTTAYDVFDRPITVTDPEGYVTTTTYDPAGNLATRTNQVWKGGEADYATLGNGFDSVTTRFSYDAANRQRQTVNPDGTWRRTTYDRYGHAVTQRDERGVVTHIYSYTYGGVLAWVAEPDMNSSTSASVTEKVYTSVPSGYVKTKVYEYSGRRLPAASRVASMTTDAATGPRTSYSYDYAGRTLTTTLPDGASTTQGYDTRGNLLSLKDALGFVTDYSYDAFGRIAQEVKAARKDGSGNTLAIDAAAGLSNGLSTGYVYDPAGNLTRETESGLVTDYHYNSRNKVIAESRPYASGSSSTLKLKVYRLDGAVTAETSYDYAGGLAANVASASTSNLPSVTAGNLTVFDQSARGDVVAEKAKGFNGGASAVVEEYSATFVVDGLARRGKRAFVGHTSTFTLQRDANGYATGSANYNSYWKYDSSGNLTENWDALPDGTNVKNRFTFAYSPTAKETASTRDVQVKLRPRREGANAELNNGILVGATTGTLTTTYNERDLTLRTVVVDNSPVDVSGLGKQTTTATDYSYYKDGAPYQTVVGGSPYQEYKYDSRGRVTWNYDSNGDGTTAMRTDTSYGSDGSTTQTLLRTSDGACRFQRVTTPTLGERDYRVEERDATITSCSVPSSLSTSSYNGGGLLLTLQTTDTTLTATGTTDKVSNFDYAYDAYGNKTDTFLAYTEAGTAYARQLVVQNSYNGSNQLTQTVATPHGGSTTTTSYTLDSKGNRLTVGGDNTPANPYYGWTKRYNADRLVTEFNGTVAGVPDYTVDRYVLFRYDADKSQILDIDATVQQHTTLAYYHIDRRTASTLSVDEDVQVIRAREGAYALDATGRIDDWSLSDRFKDETFTFADGILEEEWNIARPFNVSKGGTLALAAPTAPISSLLQVAPLEVRAPGTPVPEVAPGADPGTVTPPAEGAEAEVEADTADSSVETQSVDTTASFDAQGLPTLGALSSFDAPVGTNVTDLQEGVSANQAFSLEAPTGALPDSLAGVNATEVTAPQDGSALPSVGNPGEVARPSVPTTPDVGSSPSDGPGAVAPPSGIGNPVVPPIANALPAPIESVAPPVGWQAETENDVTTLAYSRDSFSSRSSVRDNDSSSRRTSYSQQRVVGTATDRRTDARTSSYYSRTSYGAPRTGVATSASNSLSGAVNRTNYSYPSQRVSLSQGINRSLAPGKPIGVLATISDHDGEGMGMTINGPNRGKAFLSESLRRQPHGNSSKSTRPQHVYEIYEVNTDATYKYGVSGTQLNKNGSSPRANSQVNYLNKNVGENRYSSRIIERQLPNRVEALKTEHHLVKDYVMEYGRQPPGNSRPKIR